MGRRWWGSFLGAFILVATVSGVALGLPGFSDRNIAAGNLNPTDRILVQQVRITGDSAKAVTIGSATVQNSATASGGQIDRIEVFDGGTALGDTTNLAGLTTAGVTINLGGYSIAAGTTHEIRIYVTVGATVAGGETVSLRVKFYYQMDSTSYTSDWLSDLSGETIRKGGFDSTGDTALDPNFFDPTDQGDVQVCSFTDSDANGNNILWQGTGTTTIVSVQNLATATTSDIDKVQVTLTVSGTPYLTGWQTWAPASAMSFAFNLFPGLPATVPDNSTLTVKVQMQIKGEAFVTDGRTIQMKVTLLVKEGDPGNEVSYEQSVTASAIQVVRKEGFESIVDQSNPVASKAKTGGDYLEQVVKVTDDDVNASNVKLTVISVRNAGTAGGAELDRIRVLKGATAIFDSKSPLFDISSFKTGIVLDVVDQVVNDDQNLTIKILYDIKNPIDGHILQPVVKVNAQEPDVAGSAYWSDEVTYPDEITLYAPGFEMVENVTPPAGGTAYSSQRFLSQLIKCEDLDENTDNVTIHPVVVKNLGTAQENPDIVKIEVMRRNTQDGTDLPMGSTTTLTGFRTSGVTIPTQANNVVVDAASGAEVFLAVYLTVAEPEQMVAGRIVQLETRVLHTEAGASYDKAVTSNQWTLAVNHRPTVDLTFTPAAPKYSDTITFTGTATDSDGDAITAYGWTFGDTGTANVQNPTHQYPNGGAFQVTFTATDARGVSGSVTKTITVEAPTNMVPTVVMTFTPTAPDISQDVTFTATVTDPDQPVGTEFTYEWDFGDGSAKSNVKSPAHQFTEKKSYTVTVKVTDARSGEGTATKTVVIGNDPPTIGALSATPISPATGEETTFVATGIADPNGDTITGYAWTFGDGGTSNEASPKHTYFAPGTYPVTLVVTDARGSDSAEATREITVTGPSRAVVIAYPNPATVQATLLYQLPDGATEPLLRAFDLTGALVYERDLAAGETTFVWTLVGSAGDALPKGLYFLVVTAKDAEGKALKSDVFKLLVQ